MAERMKKTRLSFRKSRWQRSDTNEIKPEYNNAFTVLGVLLTELANAAASVLLTVCAVSVVNTTVSHVRCPYYVYVWLFIFSVISGFINRLTSLDTRKWVRHAINTGLLLVFLLGVFIANWHAHIISNAYACGTAVHRQKPKCQRGCYAHAVYTLVSYRRWQRTHSGRI